MQPRIFISHSAKDDETNALLQALERGLTEDGFDVLIDRTRLRVEGTGTEWPSTLNQWLEICHGAILLVSPHALLSDWVRNEAIILNFRLKSSDNKFPFLIVHTAGTQAADIAGAKFGLTSLDKVQSVRNDVPGTTLQRARDLFGPLRHALEASEEADLCFEISTELEDCGEESLIRAGRMFDADLSKWHPRVESKRHALANLLMGTRLDHAAFALRQIPARHCAKPENIINLLEPSWADARSVGWLTDEFTKKPPPQAAVVPGHYLETIKCHLLRATRRSRLKTWTRCELPKTGDREPDDTINHLANWFAQQLEIQQDDREKQFEKIRAAIERKTQRGHPVIFVFRSAIDYSALHDALHKVFGRFYSIILDVAAVSEFARMPYLEPRREEEYHSDRKDALLTLASRI
jgi:TIR domain